MHYVYGVINLLALGWEEEMLIFSLYCDNGSFSLIQVSNVSFRATLVKKFRLFSRIRPFSAESAKISEVISSISWDRT